MTSPGAYTNAVTAQEVLTDRSGVIEIQMAGAVVRFDGKADLTVIRAMLGLALRSPLCKMRLVDSRLGGSSGKS